MMSNDFNLNDAIVQWFNDYASRGIVATDMQLIVRSWNRWLEQQSGRSAAQTLGRPLFEIFPELLERNFDRFYDHALKGHIQVLSQSFHQYFVKLPALPDHQLPEMLQTARISPLIKDGKIVGTITVIDDVTERVVKEDELDLARREAERANEAKDRFVAMLSHDLRTPLTSILAWTRMIRNGHLDAQKAERGMESIERNAMVQLQLIEQLLDISRIATGKLQLQTEPLDVKEAIESALLSLRPIAEDKDIKLEIDLPDHGRIVHADPKRIQQIVWNLISNALKFTPKGGDVRASLLYGADNFELIITDTGAGIPREHISRIFEPLWQEANSGQGGLGLGLAIVRELVASHGGSIRADSGGIGKGATFTVTVPWNAESNIAAV